MEVDKPKELTNKVNGAPRKRLVNCFGLGLAENGRLGIGPPDDLRQVEEAGFVIGWHQPEEEEDGHIFAICCPYSLFPFLILFLLKVAQPK